MIKKIAVIFVLVFGFFGLRPWSFAGCLERKFPPLAETVRLQLANDIHNDTDMPIFLVRFFHNKPVYFSLEILRRGLFFGDINNFVFCLTR